MSQGYRTNWYANDGLLTRIVNWLTALRFNIEIVDESHRNKKNLQPLLNLLVRSPPPPQKKLSCEKVWRKVVGFYALNKFPARFIHDAFIKFWSPLLIPPKTANSAQTPLLTSSLTHGQVAGAHVEATFCVATDFPEAKSPRENVHGYVKKETKKLPTTVPEVRSLG